MRGRKAILCTTLVGLQLMTGGCYRYHLLAPEPDPVVTACRRTVHALAWGLITHDTRASHCEGAVPDSVASACQQSNAIDQVMVTSNFGYTLLTIVTLGFWSPVRLEWHCAKPVEEPGVIGSAGP
ncbi:MAG: hypothetical protein H0X69_15905 [Gemmatimonadales bacterium]|nr:hypothetical protein [Gemmatimonadales bacterium]